jgi:hypothetical protein
MAKKCVRCKRRTSVSVDEPYIPPLCRTCWNAEGKNIRRGTRVFDTEAWPDYTGTVVRLDGHLALVKLDGGSEAWLPRPTLITATA